MTKPPDQASTSLSTLHSGAIYAILAYSAWGLLPIYWKAFGTIPPIEVLSHRIVWSMLFLFGLLLLQQRRSELAALWRSPKSLRMLLATGLLLSFNWGLYIYAVNNNHVVESSLGYYINPLISVLLGFLFLKERLHWGQQVAVLFAMVGVLNFIWSFGSVPWIALGLGFTFGIYGLLRKIIAVAPMVGLAVETLLVTPIAIAYISYAALTDTGHLTSHWLTTLLFIGAGITTSMPLLWFNNAAKRLRLATLGFFQYIAPSIQLLLGVFLYHEPFTPTHIVTFGCIWCALLIYSTTSLAMQSRS